ARSMGLTVFSLFNIAFALETSNEDKSIFAVDLRSNATLLKAAGVAFLFTVIATEVGFLQRLLGTVSLDTRQFAICLLVALSIVVIAEGRKLLGIRTVERPAVAATEPVPAPVS
ncbi:MAG TPA: cation-translocating P-type ATPase C-terminal domain-containing protein, partial [Candidatus Limnocylindrales bacterium]